MKSFKSLFKESLQAFKSKWKPFLLLLFIFLIICGTFPFIKDIVYSYLPPIEINWFNGLIILFLIITSFVILFKLFYTIFIIYYLTIIKTPEKTPVKEILREARRKLCGGVILSFSLWVFLFIVLCVMPIVIIHYFSFFRFFYEVFTYPCLVMIGIIALTYFTYFTFSLHIYLNEDKKGIKILKQSYNLVKGNAFKIFSKIMILNFFLIFLLSICFIVYQKAFPLAVISLDPVWKIGNVLIGATYFLSLDFFAYLVIVAIYTISISFIVVFKYLMYLDIKRLKEQQTVNFVENIEII